MPDYHRVLRKTNNIINPGRRKGESEESYRLRIALAWHKNNKNWDHIEAIQELDSILNNVLDEEYGKKE